MSSISLKPYFITDESGNKISVVLSIDEYNLLMEELEEIEDVRLYDEAKMEDDGERILFSEYLKHRKEKIV